MVSFLWTSSNLISMTEVAWKDGGAVYCHDGCMSMKPDDPRSPSSRGNFQIGFTLDHEPGDVPVFPETLEVTVGSHSRLFPTRGEHGARESIRRRVRVEAVCRGH